MFGNREGKAIQKDAYLPGKKEMYSFSPIYPTETRRREKGSPGKSLYRKGRLRGNVLKLGETSTACASGVPCRIVAGKKE